MEYPPIPNNEVARLATLESFHILDSIPEKDYDEIVRLAAAISGMPISIIGFIDNDQHWYKSAFGIKGNEVARELSFCGHAINDPLEALIINDARADNRFFDNPAVTGDANVVFYAGFPLTTNDGFALGTLCLIDNKPNTLSIEQRKLLKSLSNQVMNLLELRKKNLALEQQEINSGRLIEIYERTNIAAKVGWWEVDFQTGEIEWSSITKMIHEVPQQYKPALGEAINFYKEGESREKIAHAVKACLQDGIPYEFELQLVTAKGNEIWVSAIGIPVFFGENEAPIIHPSLAGLTEGINDIKVKGMNGTFQEITHRKKNEATLEQKNKELQHLNDLTNLQNTRLQNFAHIISHNIRSHITNMSGVIQLADKNIINAGDMIFEVFKKSVNGLEETIENLNEVIYIQSNLNVPKRVLNIEEELKKITTLLHIQIVETEASVELTGDTTEIFTNPAYFESIVQNLVSNAIKYRSPERKPVITIALNQQEQFTVLTVSDNGSGIDLVKYGTKLFGMYKTFHRNKDAKGLGLFITKTQIEALGGKIDIQSTVNEGSTFTVYFPMED